MATLCDTDWSSCNLAHAGSGVSVNGKVNSMLHLGDGPVKLRKEDAGTKASESDLKPKSCILGMATATPERVFPMAEFATAVLHGFGEHDTPEVREFSTRLCKSSGIMKKHMALGREMYAGDPNMCTYGAPSLDKRFSLFASEAIKLGARAAEGAIRDWGGDKSKVTHLITYSTSGMTSPALDMQLIKVLGLDQSVKHFWCSLMGCHAGLVGIRTAAEIAQADATNRVLVVCVEINSAHAQPLDHGIVQAKLSQSGLLATLNKNVPLVVGQNCGNFVAQLLQGTGLKTGAVNWAVHPGGKAVVDAVEKGCSLEQEQLRFSRYVLENYANMSSPTILFVLDKLREEAHKLPTGVIHPWTVAVGFGPGMTIEGILLKNC